MTNPKNELKELVEQLRSLVEHASRLPCGAERRAAFEEIETYQVTLEVFTKRTATRLEK